MAAKVNYWKTNPEIYAKYVAQNKIVDTDFYLVEDIENNIRKLYFGKILFADENTVRNILVGISADFKEMEDEIIAVEQATNEKIQTAVDQLSDSFDQKLRTELFNSVADYNQNNFTAKDYIKNRPCYKTKVLVKEGDYYTIDWEKDYSPVDIFNNHYDSYRGYVDNSNEWTGLEYDQYRPIKGLSANNFHSIADFPKGTAIVTINQQEEEKIYIVGESDFSNFDAIKIAYFSYVTETAEEKYWGSELIEHYYGEWFARKTASDDMSEMLLSISFPNTYKDVYSYLDPNYIPQITELEMRIAQLEAMLQLATEASNVYVVPSESEYLSYSTSEAIELRQQAYTDNQVAASVEERDTIFTWKQLKQLGFRVKNWNENQREDILEIFRVAPEDLLSVILGEEELVAGFKCKPTRIGENQLYALTFTAKVAGKEKSVTITVLEITLWTVWFIIKLWLMKYLPEKWQKVVEAAEKVTE